MTEPRIELRVFDRGSLARSAAAFVEERARAVITDHARFVFAVSGGRTPWATFASMRTADLPWPSR